VTASAAESRRALVVGLALVFAPIATLVAVRAATGSAVWASVAALSLSPTMQLAFEGLWPARAMPPRTREQLGVEAFQGIAYGTFLGVGTVVGVWWLVSSLRAVLGVELALHAPLWLEAFVLVVVADFLDYFRHRHEHESNGLFWRVHSVHHSIRQFSLLTGLALHPLETVFTFFSYGLVAGLLGLSFDATVLGFSLALIAMGAQHTNTATRLGFLSHLIAHADGHRWHHDIALGAGRNVNYANVFSLWDRLWGTHHPALPYDGDYGIEPFRDAYPKDLLGQARMAFAGGYAAAEAAALSAHGAPARAGNDAPRERTPLPGPPRPASR